MPPAAPQALVGLEAVHQAGVVHRDLKPENIVLVPEAGGVIPKLVDFGISRPEGGQDEAGSQKLTAPGATMGTPWYMSPEQVRGRKDLDRRTDIYSTGVILYEAMAGKLPYDDEDNLQLFRKIAVGGVMPLIDVRPEVGPHLSTIVERAMARSTGARFATASEMAGVLFSVASHVPEALVCPIRAHDAATSLHSVVPDTFISSDSEISSEMLAAVPIARARSVQAYWHHPLTLVAGIAVALLVVSIFVLVRPAPPPATAIRTSAAGAPAIVPLSSPPAAVVDSRVSAGAPAASIAKPVVKRAKARSSSSDRRGRGKKTATAVPEAFSSPGF